MAKWLAKEFDWDTGRYTGRYYDIAEAGVVAVFVDSFYGLDTNAGTAAAPFKTLGKAITTLNSTGANGSRIFMNGIFSENLPAQTYWYEFIGCGGGWNGRTIWRNNIGVMPTITKPLAKYHNIHTLDYDHQYIHNSSSTTNYYYYFVNCIIRNVRIRARNDFFVNWFCIWNDIITNSQVNNITFQSIQSILINMLLEEYIPTSVSRLVFNGHSNYLKINPDTYPLPGGKEIINNHTNSLEFPIEPQFIKETDNDYNVRITSPLINTGKVDEITGISVNIGGVRLGLPYNGLLIEFTTAGGATITDLTVDSTGKFTITAPATSGTLETGLMDLGNIYPLENIDLFNVFDFLSGEITQGVFETFSSPRMALTIKLKYGLTSAEVDDCPWLLIEYGKQPTFSGTGASRVGNAADTFDPDTFQTITCRYMKLFITLQNNS